MVSISVVDGKGSFEMGVLNYGMGYDFLCGIGSRRRLRRFSCWVGSFSLRSWSFCWSEYDLVHGWYRKSLG